MRVGYVLKCFPRLSETFILTELLELEKLGLEVTIFSRHAPEGPVPHGAIGSLRAPVVNLEPLLGEGLGEPIKVHLRLARRLGRAHEESLEAAMAMRDRKEMRAWLLAGVVAERALEEGFDLVHAHFATGSASVARYAGRMSGIPFTFTSHAKDIYSDQVDRERLRRLLRESAAPVTISEANRSFLLSLEPRSQVRRIYNGLDLARFARRAEPPAGGAPLLLFVGRMVEKKGLADLLQACAILRRRGRSLRCRLVGSGPLEEELRRRCAALGLQDQVTFAGDASQEEIVDRHLPEASVFVLPCVVAADGDRDGIPTTLLEAMARGVPVVSTRLSGIPEAVPHGEAGLLVEPGDAGGLADAIAGTLQDRRAALRRVAAARARVERMFDARRNAASLAELFASVARTPTVGRGAPA